MMTREKKKKLKLHWYCYVDHPIFYNGLKQKGCLLSGMQTQHRLSDCKKLGQLGHIGCAKQTNGGKFLIEK